MIGFDCTHPSAPVRQVGGMGGEREDCKNEGWVEGERDIEVGVEEGGIMRLGGERKKRETGSRGDGGAQAGRAGEGPRAGGGGG